MYDSDNFKPFDSIHSIGLDMTLSNNLTLDIKKWKIQQLRSNSTVNWNDGWPSFLSIHIVRMMLHAGRPP
jgi:hypothetical protein